MHIQTEKKNKAFLKKEQWKIRMLNILPQHYTQEMKKKFILVASQPFVGISCIYDSIPVQRNLLPVPYSQGF